jgi:hypothetical protein
MKKHLSVLMLVARSTIYKLLAVIFVMAAAEGALFYFVLNKALVAQSAGLTPAGLEQLFVQSRAAWVYAVSFLLVVALLCMTGCEYGSKQGYTLRRLSVSERSIFLWQAAYNTFCFIFLWAAQIVIVFALCTLYLAKADPSAVSGQTVFLAFYRSSFLHSLLPLEETSRYIRNGILALGLGVSSACFSFRQRRSEVGAEIIALTSLSLVFFARGVGSLGNDVLVLLLSAAVTAEAIARVYRKEADDAI